MEKKTKLYLLEFIILIVISSFDSRLLLGLLWVFLHEIVHVLVAKTFDVNLDNIKISLTGASAKFNTMDDVSDRIKLLIYLSGPLFNMLMAIVLMWIEIKYGVKWLDESIKMNIGLGVFNLFPAYPLDGIRIYEILIGKKILYKKTKKICTNMSFIFAGILMVLFFSTVYIHKANFSLLLVAILITYTTFIEKEQSMYILMGDLIRKRQRLIKDSYIENKNISIYYKNSLIKILSLVDRNKFNSFFVLNEDFKLIGIVYEDELIEALKKYGNITLDEFIKLKKSDK